MAQQRRMVYAKLFENLEFSGLSREARLTYIGTIIFADDDGRLRANSLILKGKIFPLDEDIQKEHVRAYINELVKKRLVTYYKVDDEWFIQHPNWKKYQVLRSDLYRKSTLPPVTKALRERNEDVTKSLPKLNQIKVNKSNTASDALAPFSLKEEIKKLEDSPRRDLNIIALYFDHRKPNFETYDQYSLALKRHLRAAKDVTVFNDTQILTALDKAKKLCPSDYTIETIKKMLTK